MESGSQLHSANPLRGHSDTRVETLPADYVLGPYDVLCGRGKKCFEHVGNQTFRKLVESTLKHYTLAPTKMEKSNIIREVTDYVCSNSEGGFVRYDPLSNRYFKLSENHAREKTSQAYRDALIGIKKGENAAKRRQDVKYRTPILARSFTLQQSPCELSFVGTMYYHSQANIIPAACGSRKLELSEIFQPNATVNHNIVDNRIQPSAMTDPFDLCQIGKVENQDAMHNFAAPSHAKFQKFQQIVSLASTSSEQLVTNFSTEFCADRSNIPDVSGTVRQDYSLDTISYDPIPLVSIVAEDPQGREDEIEWELLESMVEQTSDDNPLEPTPLP